MAAIVRTHHWMEPAGRRAGSMTRPGWSGCGSELKVAKKKRMSDAIFISTGPVSLLFLTNVTQVHQAVLADVRARAGLRRHNAAAAAAVRSIADDAQPRRLDATRQVDVKDAAKLL